LANIELIDAQYIISHCLVSDNRRCRAACWRAAYRPCPHTPLSPAQGILSGWWPVTVHVCIKHLEKH